MQQKYRKILNNIQIIILKDYAVIVYLTMTEPSKDTRRTKNLLRRQKLLY
jgi:hypothetical protein